MGTMVQAAGDSDGGDGAGGGRGAALRPAGPTPEPARRALCEHLISASI
jgi:hypothetical protein